MEQTNRELVATVFPTVPPRDGVGEHETLLSIAKARRVLGYDPAFSWRSASRQ
jgi:UDP-glucose 4-epimerase